MGRIRNLETENDNQKKEIRRLTDLLHRHKIELDDLTDHKNKNVKTLQNIQFANMENENLRKQVDQLRDEKEKLIHQINELNLIQKNLEISLKNNLNNVEALRKERDDLLRDHGNLSESHIVLKKNSDGHVEKNRILESDIKNLHDNHKQLHAEKENLNGMLINHINNLNQKNKENFDLNTQLKTRENENKKH